MTSTSSIEDILALDIQNKVVYLIGRPTAGKTRIANLFKKKGTYVFHTDDILNNEYLKEVIMKEAKGLAQRYGGGCIIEGMGCYELLLNESHQPEIVIDIQISRAKQEEIYRKERDAKKIKYQTGFYNKHLAMLNQWLANKPPETQYVEFKNEW